MWRQEAIEWVLREAVWNGGEWAAAGLVLTGTTTLTGGWIVHFRVNLAGLTWPG